MSADEKDQKTAEEKNKKEESHGTMTKVVVAVFGTVIAPILVAAGVKFSDSLFSSTAPANPENGKPVVEGKTAATIGETRAESARPAAAASTAATNADGWTSLFNGRDLSGWSVAGNYLDRWSVNPAQSLVGTAEAGKKNRNWLFTDEEFSDFRLRFEFRLAPNTESGVAVRTPHTFNVKDGRIAISLTNDSSATAPTGTLVTWSGGVAHVQAAPKMAVKLRPDDEWNQLELEFRGSHLTLIINRDTLLDMRVDDRRGKGASGLHRSSGRIALECKAGRAKFRNMEVQRLH